MNTVDEWLAHLTLKRRGTEWVGPCPACGGRDRFHLRPGGKHGTLVGCRGCIDGQPVATRQAAYFRIVEIVFGAAVLSRQMPRPVWRKARQDEAKRHESAARKAQAMLDAARPRVHPYLALKGFPNQGGLVMGDNLLVPVRDANGTLMSMQTISPAGDKKYLFGGRMKAGRYHIGRERERWICEGLATALSVLRAVKYLHRRASVVVAFHASNIRHVAQAGDRVVVDHDLWTCRACRHRWDERRPAKCPKCSVTDGLDEPAGAKHGRAVRLPWWQPDEPGDANDYHLRHGLRALVDGLRQLL